MDCTDHARNMNALEWAELCASKTCIKILKKQKPRSLKKTNSHKKDSSKEGCEHTRPLRKFKDSVSGVNHSKQINKELRGMESLVACVSAPTIPMIIANASPPPNIQQLFLDSNSRHQDARRHSSPKVSAYSISTPRIEITSDTGECIIPTKHFFTTPPCKKHPKQ